MKVHAGVLYRLIMAEKSVKLNGNGAMFFSEGQDVGFGRFFLTRGGGEPGQKGAGCGCVVLRTI